MKNVFFNVFQVVLGTLINLLTRDVTYILWYNQGPPARCAAETLQQQVILQRLHEMFLHRYVMSLKDEINILIQKQ